MLQHVIVCESFGCDNQSEAHRSIEMTYHYERLVNSWCRFDEHLGGKEEPEYMDMCPACAVERLMLWFYEYVWGNDNFGAILKIQPDGYGNWLRLCYQPSRFQAGHALRVHKGHNTTGEDGAHILPAFIFEY